MYQTTADIRSVAERDGNLLEELIIRRESVLAAINKIENGAQEYRIGSRTVRRADLGALYGEWRRLNDQITEASRPSATVAVLPRRR